MQTYGKLKESEIVEMIKKRAELVAIGDRDRESSIPEMNYTKITLRASAG